MSKFKKLLLFQISSVKMLTIKNSLIIILNISIATIEKKETLELLNGTNIVIALVIHY